MRTLLAPLVLIAAPVVAAPGDLHSISGMQSHDRILLVFAPSLKDARLETQRKVMARFGAGAAERDLIFVQVAQGQVIGAHDRENRLRRTFDTPPGRYRTLLIGKDGHVALDAAGPLDEDRLRQAIDAMPMRQDEMRRAKAGLGKPKS